ncbi:hypothetical protein NE575_05645 [Clostridium sp. SL.3.18]|nr:hypothetical protein [Clostridium sp. SL.3.18]
MATRPRGWGGDSCDALAPASLARICKPAKESPIAAPLLQANISGKDIPDAAASHRYRRPSLAGSRQSPAIRMVARAIGYALRRKDAPPEEVSIAAHHLQTIHKTT